MNRRNFCKSCGGAVAALMLPFGVKVEAMMVGMDSGDNEITLSWFNDREGNHRLLLKYPFSDDIFKDGDSVIRL